MFKVLETKWKETDIAVPLPTKSNSLSSSKVYFVDFPGAKQSEIRIGSIGLAFTDPDYF